MPTRTIILVVILLTLIVAGMFAFAYLKQQELQENADRQDAINSDTFTYLESIAATKVFVEGTHFISGEVVLPTPCYELRVDPQVAESFPEQVTLQFTVVEESQGCIQVLSPTQFSVEVEVSENATFKARFMGRPVQLTLTEVEEY